MKTKSCRHCGEPFLETHGNSAYCPDKGCGYEAKKLRSKNQYANKSLQADPIWANEKILRDCYYKYGPNTEIDPNELAVAGFDFAVNAEERKVDDLIIFCMKNFGFSFLKNENIILWKLS